jgi:hypothetical protein
LRRFDTPIQRHFLSRANGRSIYSFKEFQRTFPP